MFLSLSTTQSPDGQQPATDLGWLLHKRPDKVQPFKTTGGVAAVFYPEATHDRCTATLLLDIDPVALVRGDGATLDQYVNDRPPNVEYNQKYGMSDDQSRHADHRFEWTRAEFATWCQTICARYQYTVNITGIGEADEVVGASSQMAVFKK